MRKLFALLLLGLLFALPAAAAVHYKSVTTPDDKRGQRMVVEGWVDGSMGKFEFLDSNAPMMPSGSYLVSQDAGKTLYLVNPKKKTYTVFDLDAMFKLAGSMMESMGPLLDLDFTAPDIDQLGQEEGEELFGLATVHSRYRTVYNLKMKVLGMKREWDIDMTQEIWSTSDLDEPGLKIWQRTLPRSTGNEELDRLIQEEQAKTPGFPLKTVTEQTMTGRKGKKTTTRTVQEVTELEQLPSLPKNTFALPQELGFEEEPLVVPGSEGGLGSLFGGDNQ